MRDSIRNSIETGPQTNDAQPSPPREFSKTITIAEFGVLLLTLAPEGYRWQFTAVPGSTFHDFTTPDAVGVTRRHIRRYQVPGP